MKNILLAIFLVFNNNYLVSQPLKLTLEESINLAIENNENLKNSPPIIWILKIVRGPSLPLCIPL